MSPREDLWKAIQCGDRDQVEQLLQQGVPVNAVDKNGYSALHLAAEAYRPVGSQVILALLLEHGANIHASTRDGMTPLHCAARSGMTERARLLIEHGASLQALDTDRKTPLHTAVESNQKEVVGLLLSSGSGIDGKNLYGSTPLRMAETSGFKEIAALIRAHQARGQSPPDEPKGFAAAETARKPVTAKTPEQLAEEVMALVRGHQGDDAQLKAKLAEFLGGKDLPKTSTHPRVNTTGFSLEHD